MANQSNTNNMTIDMVHDIMFSSSKLDEMTIPKLKQLCRDNNFVGFSTQKKKEQLIQFIRDKVVVLYEKESDRIE